MKHIFVAGLMTLALTGLGSVPVMADAKNLFTKLDGTFRGSGSASIGKSGKKLRVTCQLTNSYGASSGKLKMSGKCASSQGSRKVNGAITHKGNAISGSYMALQSNAKVSRSSGKMSGNSLTIFSTYVDEVGGKLIKIRQNIKLTGSGFKADFQTYDKATKKYKSSGSLNFKRR